MFVVVFKGDCGQTPLNRTRKRHQALCGSLGSDPPGLWENLGGPGMSPREIKKSDSISLLLHFTQYKQCRALPFPDGPSNIIKPKKGSKRFEKARGDAFLLYIAHQVSHISRPTELRLNLEYLI